jgi:hypothetical protein
MSPSTRVASQKATPVAKDVGVGEQIDDEKQRSGDSQCRNSGGIKSGEINSRLVKGGEASDQKWIVIVAKQLNDTAPNRLWRGDPGSPHCFGFTSFVQASTSSSRTLS